MEETEIVKNKTTRKRTPRSKWIMFGMGLLVGVLTLGAFRFFSVSDHHVHYHADFALYVDGQRDEFKSPTYYEEVQSCGGGEVDNPRIRVHLHDDEPSAVHVHDNAVTWGALFANLGYVLGDQVIRTSSGVHVDGQDGKKLTFLLNGEFVPDVANRVVGDKDVLLISYGDETVATQKSHYNAIPRTAEKHDNTADPAACSGSHPLTWQDRLKAAIGLDRK